MSGVAGLRVERYTELVEGASFAEWAALHDRVPDALPFTSPDWLAAWWTHLRRRDVYRRDLLRVYMVRDGDELVGVAPMLLTEYGLPVLGAIRLLHPIGADPNLTEVRGLLVAPEQEGAVLRTLLTFLQEHETYDWLHFGGLGIGSEELGLALAGVPHVTIIREQSTFLLDLSGNWESFRRSLSGNMRESLRKCYSSLRRDGHEWTFRMAATPDAIMKGLPALQRLHEKRSEVRDAVIHANVFSTERARGFLADVVERFATRGRARLFELEIGGTIVASRVAFQVGNSLYLYYSGYSPEWGRYSVMTTLMAELLRRAMESGLELVNLSTGADRSKLRWRPREVTHVGIVIVRERAWSRFWWRLFKGAREMRVRLHVRRQQRRGAQDPGDGVVMSAREPST